MPNKYYSVNIRDYLVDSEIGESGVSILLSSFSCDKNIDVDRFLKENAVDFTRKNQSVTYFVLSTETQEMLGYYTVAIKPISVKTDRFSNTMNKRIARVSEYDDKTDSFNLSAYLIAQIGKNFSKDISGEITGEELLQCALDSIKELQYGAGGMVYFLEAENKEKLLSFYEKNGFKRFDTRETKPKSEEPHELVQLLKII